jgi:lipoate-protein ligase A
VRRPTGGAALVHHHELTYAFALPPGRLWQPLGQSWLVRMHDIVRQALAGLGIASTLCEQERGRGEVLCFLHHTPGDLLVGDCKVAGSAQRKQRGALLQHGSILLARSPCTPSLPGLAELTGHTLSPTDLVAALLAEWTRATGWDVHPAEWSADDQRVLHDLLSSRYTSPAWNQRR